MARKRTTDKQHRWLSQVEVTGVVFSEPVLAEAAPSGFPNLDKKVLARFHKAREIWNLPKGMLKDDGQAAWVRFVLEEILRLRSSKDWLVGSAIPAELVVRLPAQQETLRPDRALVDDGAPVLLLLEVPRKQSLDRPWVQPTGRWKASPTTKLERLLRETKVELGLVTNGEAWRLVVASPSETASWLTWTASSWAESPVTLAAFRDLLGEERFFAGAQEDVALELIRRSRERQLDVADQLGEQARQALALLVHELDRVDAECGGAYLDTYTEREVFEAIVAFIMRLLFLLFAEENALLPHGSVAYDRSYGVLHLLTELEGQHRLSPEKLKHSYSAFARLLATSRLIHDGSVDPDIRIAAHGGRLFDPDRYPLLEGRRRDGGWAWEPAAPPRVSDAVVREVLRSLKYAQADGSRQLVSYRTLAVEQIGHMYEGLLDLRILRAPSDQALILLEPSPKQVEPQVRWHEVQGLAEADCVTLLAKRMSRTKAQVTKALERARKYPSRGEASSADLPSDHPAVLIAKSRGVIRPGGRYLGLGEDRHSQGTHYTPLAVTQPMVRRLLRPLTRTLSADDGTTSLRTAQEILALRVCDPAAGSGAFLVQATRFLAEELVEAWEAAEAAAPDSKLSLPFATPTRSAPEELLMPADRSEKELWAKRYIVEHCIYGVDINPLAVEMAKLSLWLVALSRDKPFTFLDHAIRSGNSVVGVNAAQLQAWSVAPDAPQQAMFADKAKKAMRRAAMLRRQVWALPPAAAEDEKAGLLQQSALATRQAGVVADLLVSAWLGEGDRDEAVRRQARDQLELAAADSEEDWQTLEGVADERLGGETPFHWAIEFPEVFVDSDGFDAVIGNPPYVRQELLGNIKRYLQEAYQVYVGTADLYTYFYELALRLVRPGGRFSMIVTNKWMKAKYGSGVRRLLSKKAWLSSVIDFGHAKQIFRGVDVFPSIVSARRPASTTAPTEFEACVIDRGDLSLHNLHAQIAEESFPIPRAKVSEAPWQLEPRAVARLYDWIRQRGVPLAEFTGSKPYYGVKTGCNDAFLLDTATKDTIIARDPLSAEIIHRYVRGRDINRWIPEWDGQWMILARHGIDIRRYPGVLEHLTPFRQRLEPRPAGWSGGKWPGRKAGPYRWFELQDSVEYWRLFSAPKIVYQEIQFSPSYALDAGGMLANNKVFFIPTDDLYLLAVLNSPLMWWFNWRYLSHMKDDALSPAGVKMRELPIAVPTEEVRQVCAAAVRQIIDARKEILALAQELAVHLTSLDLIGPGQFLADPFTIDQPAYLRAVARLRGVPLKRDERRLATTGREQFVQRARPHFEAIRNHEATASTGVIQAYGLDESLVQTLRDTSPPRTPWPQE